MFPKNQQKIIVVFGGSTYAGANYCFNQLNKNHKIFVIDDIKNLESSKIFNQHERPNIHILTTSSDLYSLEKIDDILIFNPSRYLESALKICYFFKPNLFVFYENDFHNRFDLFERYNKSHLIFFQDLYGPQMNFSEDNPISKIFSDVLFSNSLKIPFKSQRKIYPLFVNDFLKAIEKIFSLNANQKILYLKGGKGLLIKDFAKRVNSKLSPKMDIELISYNFSETINELPKNNLKNWQPKVSPEQGISKTLGSLFLEEKKAKDQKKHKTNFEFSLKKITYCIFLVFLITFLSITTLSVVNVRTLQGALKSGDYSSLKQQITLSNYLLKGGKVLAFGLSRSVGLVDQEKGQKIEKGYQAVVLMVDAAKEITKALDEGQIIAKAVLGNEELNLLEKTKLVSAFLVKANSSFGESQSLLAQTSGLGIFDKQIQKINNTIPEIRRWLNDSSEMVQLTPEILGVTKSKKYLVLFQNNSEIRPSGGFIGSFAIITMNKGRLSDFKVMDVYSADGQLKGHVQPPDKLKEFLGQESWYLRDSNWSPDFPTSANKAIWFLEKEIGQKVDGVIAVNLTVAQRILEATGEIYLPDYNEKVNSSNFFEKAEYHSEAGFFPGSTAKKDYLGQVSNILFDKVKNGDANLMSKVGKVLFNSLEEKEMQIYLADDSLTKKMMKIGWGGEVKDPRCQNNKNCLMDYLFVVESNVGMNKSNYFLRKEMRHKVDIENGQIKSKIIIDYKNESPNDVFPAGNYKSYLRVYTPKGAVLDSCFIGKDKCGVDWVVEFNKEVFGLLIEVPYGKTKRLEISWYQLKNFNGGDYFLYWQKQSGDINKSVSFTLNFSKDYYILSTSPSVNNPDANRSALTGEGQIVYNTSLSRDTVFGANLKK